MLADEHSVFADEHPLLADKHHLLVDKLLQPLSPLLNEVFLKDAIISPEGQLSF